MFEYEAGHAVARGVGEVEACGVEVGRRDGALPERCAEGPDRIGGGHEAGFDAERGENPPEGAQRLGGLCVGVGIGNAIGIGLPVGGAEGVGEGELGQGRGERRHEEGDREQEGSGHRY